MGPQSAAYPDGRGAVGTGTPGAAPLGTSLAQRTGTRGAAHPLASRRFDFEPPVFGEAPTSQPPADRGYPTPQSPFFEDAPTPEPHFSTSPAPGTAVGPPDEPAPPEAPGPSMSTYGSPSFRPIADIVDEAITDRLSWLERLSTGRLLRLHQLGYDDPVKIANLRPAEVTRLARALQVTEDEILTEWIPAARKELGMRLATSHSGSATKA